MTMGLVIATCENQQCLRYYSPSLACQGGFLWFVRGWEERAGMVGDEYLTVKNGSMEAMLWWLVQSKSQSVTGMAGWIHESLNI